MIYKGLCYKQGRSSQKDKVTNEMRQMEGMLQNVIIRGAERRVNQQVPGLQWGPKGDVRLESAGLVAPDLVLRGNRAVQRSQ